MKEDLRQRGVTVRSIARAAAVSDGFVYDVLSGRAPASHRVVGALAEALGLTDADVAERCYWLRRPRQVQPAKWRLQEVGVSASRVAYDLGLARQTVWKYLNGAAEPSNRFVEHVERVTGLPRELLFTSEPTS